MQHGLEWLRSPIFCEGRVLRLGLDPTALFNEHLPDVCLRMSLILDSIEFERCEGRLINLDIFNSIDNLESALRHQKPTHLVDWSETIARFGRYYNLDGVEPIVVTKRAAREAEGLARAFRIDFGH